MFKVIRPGSLSRGTAHSSNLMRDVYGVIFDTITKTFTRITIPTQKASDVFKEIKYVEKSLEASSKQDKKSKGYKKKKKNDDSDNESGSSTLKKDGPRMSIYTEEELAELEEEEEIEDVDDDEDIDYDEYDQYYDED